MRTKLKSITLEQQKYIAKHAFRSRFKHENNSDIRTAGESSRVKSHQGNEACPSLFNITENRRQLERMKASIVRKTYKSLLSKHCSQKSALLGGRTRSAEVDMVLGSPPVAPMLPALRAGELMPPPHLFRPPPQPTPPTVDPMNSIKPPLVSDIVLYVPRSLHCRTRNMF